MRTLTFLIPAAIIAGCAPPNHAERWPDRFLLSGGPQPGYAIKQVIEKQSPTALVADDGSVCRTSSERFDSTKEGQWIDCIWNLPVLDSTEVVQGNHESEDGRPIAALD
jgi:hypothetical protein